MKVLLIDSRNMLLGMVQHALVEAGYQILTIQCTPEAFVKTETFEPDLIILNIAATECDPFELCNQIRSLPQGAVLPILFIGTGNEIVKNPPDALVYGGDYYYQAPLVIPEIIRKVQTYIGEGDSPPKFSDLPPSPPPRSNPVVEIPAPPPAPPAPPIVAKPQQTRVATENVPVNAKKPSKSLEDIMNSDRFMEQFDKEVEDIHTAPGVTSQSDNDLEAQTGGDLEEQLFGDMDEPEQTMDEQEQNEDYYSQDDEWEDDHYEESLQEELPVPSSQPIRPSRQMIQRSPVEQRIPQQHTRQQQLPQHYASQQQVPQQYMSQQRVPQHPRQANQRTPVQQSSHQVGYPQDSYQPPPPQRRQPGQHPVSQQRKTRQMQSHPVEPNYNAYEQEKYDADYHHSQGYQPQHPNQYGRVNFQEQKQHIPHVEQRYAGYEESYYNEPQYYEDELYADQNQVAQQNQVIRQDTRQQHHVPQRGRRTTPSEFEYEQEQEQEELLPLREQMPIRKEQKPVGRVPITQPPQRDENLGFEAPEETHGSLLEQDTAIILTNFWKQPITGSVEFRNGSHIRILYYEEGNVVDVSSNLPVDQIEDFLLREGKISRSQFNECRVQKFPSARHTSSYLASAGYLKPDEVFWAVRERIIEVIFGILEWTQGEYYYLEELTSEDSRVILDRSFPDILLEGVRRKFSNQRMIKVIGSNSSILKKEEGQENLLDGIHFQKEERKLLRLLDGNHSVEDLVFSSGLSIERVNHLLYTLVTIGYARVAVRGVEGIDQAGQSPTDEIDSRRIEDKFNQIKNASYFEILNVTGNVSDYELERCYKKLKKEFEKKAFSPILRDEYSTTLEEIQRGLDEAFDVLRDGDLRQSYGRYH